MKVYSFRASNKRSAIEIEAKVDYDDVALTRAPSTIKDNNVFDIYKGKKAFDAICYCDSVNWVFSERVKNIFEKNNIKGIEFYPIIVNNLKEKYYGYYITGKAGKILNVDDMDMPPMFEPIEFDENEWDGSDIFCFKNSGAKYITEKVKLLIEENDLSNIELREEN
ncbi:hypothetical protein [uncultured Aquimarina sp.]|uniref:hypothetical protein n=1 Tax=uncultured Aquimarina sp. TaxID=575652 RepID=UPI002632F9CB|nr:hypothetical protein [uncultured Aquimarina sp.]